MKIINADELKVRVLSEVRTRFAEEVCDIIDSMPEAEAKKEVVKEVVKEEPHTGKWITRKGVVKCSECKGIGEKSWGFCPYCGSVMR